MYWFGGQYLNLLKLICSQSQFILRSRPHQDSGSFTAAVYIDIHNGQPPAERPLYTEGSVVRLWDFLDTCWDLDPTKRPSAASVSQFITSYGDEIAKEIDS